MFVWQRDGGRVRSLPAGGNDLLEFDHIIPVAMGGATHGPEPAAAVRDLQSGEGRDIRLTRSRGTSPKPPPDRSRVP